MQSKWLEFEYAYVRVILRTKLLDIANTALSYPYDMDSNENEELHGRFNNFSGFKGCIRWFIWDKLSNFCYLIHKKYKYT